MELWNWSHILYSWGRAENQGQMQRTKAKSNQKCPTCILSAWVEQAGSVLPSLYILSHLNSTSTHSLIPLLACGCLPDVDFFLHIMLANNDCCPTYHYRCQTLNAPCWLVLILILEYKLYLFKTKVSKLYRLYILLCSNTVWVYDTIFNATLKTDIWLTGPIKEYGSFNHYLASVKRDLVR